MTDDVKLTSHEFALAFEEFYAAYCRFEYAARLENKSETRYGQSEDEALRELRLFIESYNGLRAKSVSDMMETIGSTMDFMSHCLASRWGVR